ncbi:MAG: DUF4136 domain-containing protein [Croceitalea sp.]|nr:DUF4136 domain-containing protein [Croceitalea sp.]
MRKFALLLILGLLASCSSVRVNYDYDRATNFSNYTTYNYFNDMDSGLSPLDEKRLLRLLDSTMQVKGFLLAEEPDMFINILSNEYQELPQNNVGVGVGGTGRNVGGGISVGLPLGRSGLKRSIQFDLVDAQKDALFWKAVSESNFKEGGTPIMREQQLRNVVSKVFAKFPPEK